MSTQPEWFANALAAARHQDEMKKWPWIGRFLHRLLIRNCPACIYWKERIKP